MATIKQYTSAGAAAADNESAAGCGLGGLEPAILLKDQKVNCFAGAGVFGLVVLAVFVVDLLALEIKELLCGSCAPWREQGHHKDRGNRAQ